MPQTPLRFTEHVCRRNEVNATLPTALPPFAYRCVKINPHEWFSESSLGTRTFLPHPPVNKRGGKQLALVFMITMPESRNIGKLTRSLKSRRIPNIGIF